MYLAPGSNKTHATRKEPAIASQSAKDSITTGSRSQVARGITIGVLFAFTPPLGLQMIAAAILATLTYSNRAAAIAAVWITTRSRLSPSVR